MMTSLAQHTPSAPPPAAVAPSQPAVDGAAFRQALAGLAAGVSILTTVGADGQKIGMTATAVTALSADPPLILVCLGGWARALSPLSAGAPFIVHLLAAEQQPLAQHFATAQADKFAGVRHVTTLAGCPRLSDALTWIECVPAQLVPAGDHTIVVGRVVGLQSDPGERAPLVYFRRRYHSLREQA
jgi:flavin reductase (DIM6/NTAB) family NADH-FMN oxidoreductase RutF